MGPGRWWCDLAAVVVVGLPLRDVVQEAPDLCGAEVGDDDFVGYEVVGCSGEVPGWPDYCGLHFVRRFGGFPLLCSTDLMKMDYNCSIDGIVHSAAVNAQ